LQKGRIEIAISILFATTFYTTLDLCSVFLLFVIFFISLTSKGTNAKVHLPADELISSRYFLGTNDEESGFSYINVVPVVVTLSWFS
jgi:hypothetical protein